MTSAGTVPFRYLAEWYRPEVMEQSVDDICAALDAGTAVLCAEGTPVRLLVTAVVATDEVVYALFAARSPDVVMEACERAGIPVQRLSADVAARISRVDGLTSPTS